MVIFRISGSFTFKWNYINGQKMKHSKSSRISFDIIVTNNISLWNQIHAILRQYFNIWHDNKKMPLKRTKSFIPNERKLSTRIQNTFKFRWNFVFSNVSRLANIVIQVFPLIFIGYLVSNKKNASICEVEMNFRFTCSGMVVHGVDRNVIYAFS